MSLLYSFVARGSVVLCEHAQCTGNFAEVAVGCLDKFDGTQSRFTVKAKEHHLNFLVDDGITYLVVSEETYPREICFYYLEQVQGEFKPQHGERAKTAQAGDFNKSFSNRLKYHMDYCVNNPGEISKIHRVKQKVDEVKGIMVQNIEKVLERGERIEVLVEKTDDLQSQAERFHVQGRNLRNKMWWENVKMQALLAGAVLLLLIIIFCSVCFSAGNCLSSDN